MNKNQQTKGVPEAIIAEIGSKKHQSISNAIDSMVDNYPVKVDDYYFMSFDMNNDFNGENFTKIEKVKISHTNELELQGQIGKLIEKFTIDENHMVIFMNKERALKLHQKITQWEDINITYTQFEEVEEE